MCPRAAGFAAHARCFTTQPQDTPALIQGSPFTGKSAQQPLPRTDVGPAPMELISVQPRTQGRVNTGPRVRLPLHCSPEPASALAPSPSQV